MEFSSGSRLRRRLVGRLQATDPCREEETSALMCRVGHPSYADHIRLEQEPEEEEVLHPLPLPLTKIQLLGLISLNLASCNLKALPDDIYVLQNLRELRVPANNLINLPSTIMRFSYLKILDASNNRLESLPEEITSCRSLVELDLGYNRLPNVPESLGKEMLKLKSFVICGNLMSSLPQSICGMTSLRILNAHSCRLFDFPDFVPGSSFVELQVLDLGNNKFAYLPRAVGSLPSLRHLDLSGNKYLLELPPTFGQLRALRSLNVKGCKWLYMPPPEVVNQGIQAIKEYMNLHFNLLFYKCIGSVATRKLGVLCRLRDDVLPSDTHHSKLL